MPIIGTYPECGARCGTKSIALHRSAGGKLTARCHRCGADLWAAPGSKAHRDMLASATLDEDGSPAPVPAPAIPPEPSKPAPAKGRTFDLGAL